VSTVPANNPVNTIAILVVVKKLLLGSITVGAGLPDEFTFGSRRGIPLS
jgi:hypothetical protein